MSCEMTRTWKKFGLNIKNGQNHFTMGKVVNGKSTRFDRTSDEYQSWLGGYTVKLTNYEKWDFKKYFELAIADQNSWLSWYNDSIPQTSIKDFEPLEVGKIELGIHKGKIYEFGCSTHSDVGTKKVTLKLRFATRSIASLLNINNSKLKLTSDNFVPLLSDNLYYKSFETLNLIGYIAIFNISKDVRLILYGNGVILSESGKIKNTFIKLKKEILKTMSSCRIESL